MASLIAPVVTGVAGAVAGNLLKKKTPNPPDMSGIMNEITNAAAEQKRITSALPTKLAPLGDKYKDDLTGAVTKARADLGAASDEYVSGAGDTGSEIYRKQADMLKQDALDASAAAARGMRANLAAGGNLNSGAGVAASRDLATTTANTIAKGQTELGIQSLAGKQKALSDVYNQNAEMVQNVLGIDQNMFQTLLNSGREDLINEATQLIQESQNETGQKTQAMQIGQQRQMAAENAKTAGQNDLTSAIIGAVGNAWGQASRKPTPVAAVRG
jgi:hypothetical protein